MSTDKTIPFAIMVDSPTALAEGYGGSVPTGGGSSLELTDGTHDLVGVSKITVTDMVVGGTPSAATLSPSAGTWTRIGQVVLAVASTSIDFSAIAGTYSQLKLFLDARGDASAVGVQIYLQMNADVGANYSWQQFYANQATVVTTDETTASNDTSIAVGYIPAGTALAGCSSSHEITIPNYAGAFHKQVTDTFSLCEAASHGTLVGVNGGSWHNTSPITELTLLLAAGNFVAGSVATLYGII